METTFTRDELNALGIIVSAAQVTGKDAKFIAALLDKISAALEACDVPPAAPTAAE